MSDFKLTGSDVFGMYCRIEQFLYCKPNEMHLYKVVASLRTNSWCEVPYKAASKEVWHDRMEDCILAIHCGIDETKVQTFRIADVEFLPRKECDREALMKLVDEMEDDARYFSDFAEKHRKLWHVSHAATCDRFSDICERYASLIREAMDACKGGSDAPMAGDDGQGGIDAHADWNEVAEGMWRIERSRYEKEISRLKDKVESRDQTIKALEETLEELDARLMPEGMEWPMVDGKSVVIGERMRSCGIDDCKVVGINPANSRLILASDNIEEGE